jgi:hypothetical protein
MNKEMALTIVFAMLTGYLRSYIQVEPINARIECCRKTYIKQLKQYCSTVATDR